VQRDSIQTAKLVASIDQVSHGWFLFGIGVGWNAEEMADHGTTDFKGRHKLARVRIGAMTAIWTRTKPEYHGDLVDFGPMMTWSKPVQKPHPPVIVGSGFPHAARRAVRYGDGWIPLAGRAEPGDVTTDISQFRQMLAEAGHSADSCPVTIFNAPEEADTLKRYRDVGVMRVSVSVPAAKADVVLPILDRWAGLIRQVKG